MSVYFLKVANGSIKIGFSSNVARRVDTLLREHGGVCLGSMPGDRTVERHFHEKFKRWRLAGEFFEETPELTQLISMVAVPGLPGREDKNNTDKVRHMDVAFAREAADAIAKIVLSIRDDEPMHIVLAGLAPAMGLSEARLCAIRDCEVDSVTVAEYSQIMAGIDLARQARLETEDAESYSD